MFAQCSQIVEKNMMVRHIWKSTTRNCSDSFALLSQSSVVLGVVCFEHSCAVLFHIYWLLILIFWRWTTDPDTLTTADLKHVARVLVNRAADDFNYYSKAATVCLFMLQVTLHSALRLTLPAAFTSYMRQRTYGAGSAFSQQAQSWQE